LTIDAFLSPDRKWTAVVQASTAGMDRVLPEVFAAVTELGCERIIDSPTSQRRTLEGLTVGERRLIRGDEPSSAIVLHHGLTLHCDLLKGQKTGFFLDQQ